MAVSEVLDVHWGQIRVSEDDDGHLVITRLGIHDGPAGAPMVRFDPRDSVVRIFPRQGQWKGHDDAYSQLKEIRVDLESTDWNPGDPLGETDRGEFRLEGLPQGMGAVIGYGLGFPRNYARLSYEVEDQTACKVLYLTDKQTKIVGDVLQMNIDDFGSFIGTVDRHRDRASSVASRLNAIEAFNAVAPASKRAFRALSPGRLPITRAMGDVVSGQTDLDTRGRDELLLEAIAETKAAAHANAATLGRLRQDVDLVTLEVLVERFDAALHGAGRASERTWQSFFAQNFFALQQLLSSPVAYVEQQVEVKISNLRGSGLRRPDFLMVNTISRIAHLVEIKTPASKLMRKSPYRGADGAEVHAPHGDLAGSVAQIQAQIESARTDLSQILSNTPNAPAINTGIVRGVVIAGTFATLDPQQRQSFLRYRDGLVGVEILTYDEVLERLRGLHTALRHVHDDGEPRPPRGG